MARGMVLSRNEFRPQYNFVNFLEERGGGGGQNGLHRVFFFDPHFFDEEKTVDDFEEVLFTTFIVSIMI